MTKTIRVMGLVVALAVMVCFTSNITRADDINAAINMVFTCQGLSGGACASQNITFNNGSVLSTNPSPDSLDGAVVTLPDFNLSYNSGAVISPSSGAFGINGGAAGSLNGTINWMNLTSNSVGSFVLDVGLAGITGTTGTSPVLASFLDAVHGSGILTFQFTDPNITGIQSLVTTDQLPGSNNTSLSATLTTPEPASLCLFGLGLLGLALVYRRRMQTTA